MSGLLAARTPPVVCVHAVPSPHDDVVVAVHADRRLRVWSLRTHQVVFAAELDDGRGAAAARVASARCRVAVVQSATGDEDTYVRDSIHNPCQIDPAATESNAVVARSLGVCA